MMKVDAFEIHEMHETLEAKKLREKKHKQYIFCKPSTSKRQAIPPVEYQATFLMVTFSR